MNETRIYASLSFDISWSGEELGLTPDSTPAEIDEALDKAINEYLNTGATAIDPPDSIECEFCGFKHM